MIKKIIVSGVFFSVLFFFLGCNNGVVYDEYIEIEDGLWDNSFKPVFNIPIDDTSSYYDIYMNIRHTGMYPYGNLFLFIDIYAPNNLSKRDTFECLLADKSGKWLGSGMGDIWDSNVKYKEKIRFSDKGTYTFQIEQAMRDNPIPMIIDMGIKIEKNITGQ